LNSFIEELLLSLSVPFPVEAIRSTVRVNIGVALFPEQATNETELMHHAEAALLRGTRKKSKYEVYEPVSTVSGQSRLVLLEEFRLATNSEQLICYYQPKVEIATGQVVGVEALVRWEHPRLGLLTPDVFLPLAEQAQLLHEVFRRVLGVAVAQSAAWRSRGLSLQTSVNVTVSDLLDADLADFVQQVLQYHLVQ